MATVQPPAVTTAYPDRSTRLLLFGILQLLIGGLCGLMGLMMAAVAALGPMPQAPQGQAMSVQMMVPAIVFYFVLAAAFVCLGVGSIRARRWAWTLTVVLSWMWLIMGVFGFLAFVLFAGPAMAAAMEQQGAPKIPPEAVVMIRIITGVLMAGIYIGLPGLFLLCYQWPSVRATCQRRDPQVRWTDRCPMPVLALSILMAMTVVSMPAALAYGCVVPLFGVYVSGAAGAAVIFLMTLLMAYLAWGTYRLKMAAWWTMLVFWIVGTVNAAVTFTRTDLTEMYEKMHMPAAQLEMMRKSGMIDTMSRAMPWMCLVAGIFWLAYLWYVRRYFVRGGQRTTSEIAP